VTYLDGISANGLERLVTVALRRRKTTSNRSQRREYGQLPHRWIYPGAFISHLMWHLSV
jgi:hypothetical protein